MVRRVQLAKPGGDEPSGRQVIAQLLIHVMDDLRQPCPDPDGHPKHGPHLGDRQGRPDPVAGGVGQQQHRSVGVLGRTKNRRRGAGHVISNNVVGVAPGLLGRFTPGVDGEPGQCRQALWKGALLNAASQLQIALQLLAHELVLDQPTALDRDRGV